MRFALCSVSVVCAALLVTFTPAISAQEAQPEITDGQFKELLADCLSLSMILSDLDTDEDRRKDSERLTHAFSTGLTKFADVRSMEDADALMSPSMARVRSAMNEAGAMEQEKGVALIRKCNALVLMALEYARQLNAEE